MTAKIRAIKPKPLNTSAMRNELAGALKRVAGEVNDDFDKTTATWKNKPDWRQTVTVTGRQAGFSTTTTDEIYGYVDRGTRPHIIRPKRAKYLAFAPGTRPKTTPRVIGSTAGSRGSTMVYSKGVQHPGNKPREFEKTLAAKWRKLFPKRMQDAMRSAARKSGHSR